MPTKRKKAPTVTENSEKNRDKRLDNLKPYQPGKSGNPGGRPKRKPITEAYAKLLENPANAEKLAQAMFDAAVNEASVKAAQEMTDRVEGKVMQGVRMEGELGILGAEERKQRVLEILRAGAARIESVQ